MKYIWYAVWVECILPEVMNVILVLGWCGSRYVKYAHNILFMQMTALPFYEPGTVLAPTRTMLSWPGWPASLRKLFSLIFLYLLHTTFMQTHTPTTQCNRTMQQHNETQTDKPGITRFSNYIATVFPVLT